MYKLGIDLGGTKIEGLVLDERGGQIFRDRIPTEQQKGYERILDNIGGMYKLMAGKIGGAPHTFGIGTPGAVSPRTGLLKNSNTQCLNGKPLAADLEKLLSRPVAIQNDANCFAMAEALMGAGKGKPLVFGVIMGTGCGGGIVYKGEVLGGSQAIGGEWGHHSIDPAGPQCWCGSRGCVERLISGGGLAERWKERTGETAGLPAIVDAYRRGEGRAVGFMKEFFHNFGRALANVINILDPDIVVLGGGVSTIDEIYTEGVEQVRRFVFSDGFETPIVRHTLGDSAGVIGAALIGV
jgi:fructokinase